MLCAFIFLNDTATSQIYTLSLHDALPISGDVHRNRKRFTHHSAAAAGPYGNSAPARLYGVRKGRNCSKVPDSETNGKDRKSTRLNSSHEWISYAVFCLKKKRQTIK